MSKSIALDPGLRGFVAAGLGNATSFADSESNRRPPDMEAVKAAAFEEGRIVARREMEMAAAKHAEYSRKLESNLEEYFTGLERYMNDKIAELAVDLSEVIVRHSLPDREMLGSILKEVVGRVADAEVVKVRAHPDDIAMLKTDITEADLGAVSGRVDFVPDATLGAGDMLVENGFGCYDARLKERFSIMLRELKERLGKADAN